MRAFILVFGLLFFLCMACLSCDNESGDDCEPCDSASGEPEWLFIQNAGGGVFEDMQGTGQYHLTLHFVSPFLTAFTDRPYRTSNTLSLADFVAFWKENDSNFQDTPPNAAVEILDASHDERTFIFELREPVYDPVEQQISYLVTPISETDGNLSEHALYADSIDNMPASFDNVALFIDNSTFSSIEGHVVESFDSEPLPGVVVVAINDSGSSVRTVVTNAAGSYRLLNLPSSTYQLRFTFTGFRTVQASVNLGTEENVQKDIVLQPETPPEGF